MPKHFKTFAQHNEEWIRSADVESLRAYAEASNEFSYQWAKERAALETKLEALEKDFKHEQQEADDLARELAKVRKERDEARAINQRHLTGLADKVRATEAQKAIRPSAPKEGLALLRYLQDRAEAFSMADYASEEILGAVAWAESWRQNALALEGAMNAASQKHAKEKKALVELVARVVDHEAGMYCESEASVAGLSDCLCWRCEWIRDALSMVTEHGR